MFYLVTYIYTNTLCSVNFIIFECLFISGVTVPVHGPARVLFPLLPAQERLPLCSQSRAISPHCCVEFSFPQYFCSSPASPTPCSGMPTTLFTKSYNPILLLRRVPPSIHIPHGLLFPLFPAQKCLPKSHAVLSDFCVMPPPFTPA